MAGDAVQPRIGGTFPRPAQPPGTRLSPGSVGPVPPFVGVRSGDYAAGGEVWDRFWVVPHEPRPAHSGERRNPWVLTRGAGGLCPALSSGLDPGLRRDERGRESLVREYTGQPRIEGERYPPRAAAGNPPLARLGRPGLALRGCKVWVLRGAWGGAGSILDCPPIELRRAISSSSAHYGINPSRISLDRQSKRLFSSGNPTHRPDEV